LQQQALVLWSHHFGIPWFLGEASALFASPKQARAMPARPMPNFFSAPRRVSDWAIVLASSSNLLFMFFLSFGLFVSVFTADYLDSTDDSSHGSTALDDF